MVLLNSPRNMSVVDFLFLSEPLLFCRRSLSLCCRCVAELCSRIFAPARAPSLALAIGWLRKLFCEPRDLVAVGHRDRLAGPARSAIVNPRQRRHIARCPRCGSVALQVVSIRAPLVRAGRPRPVFEAGHEGVLWCFCETVKERKTSGISFPTFGRCSLAGQCLGWLAKGCLFRRGVRFAITNRPAPRVTPPTCLPPRSRELARHGARFCPFRFDRCSRPGANPASDRSRPATVLSTPPTLSAQAAFRRPTFVRARHTRCRLWRLGGVGARRRVLHGYLRRR